MKKLFATIVLLCAFFTLKSQTLNFAYNVQADLTSCYIWRGLYNGGLSFQPDLSIGWTSEHTSLDFGTWMNFGASDWGFRKGLPQTEEYNPNTQFNKELDIYLSANLWGVTFGIAHYYFFDGENYFNFGNINDITGSAQTELNLGYDFSTLLPDVDLQLSWNTMVSGSDINIDGKRAYSTYIEASYTHYFDHEISLNGVVGVSPWRSMYTDGDDEQIARNFAVNNISLRFDKAWTFKSGLALTLFAQGTMNTCNLNKENAFICASGDDKLNKQKLMGAIGISIAFGN